MLFYKSGDRKHIFQLIKFSFFKIMNAESPGGAEQATVDPENGIKLPSFDESKKNWSDMDDEEKEKLKEEVVKAVKEGDLDRIKVLRREHDIELESCTSSDNHGDNPLHLAAYYGHLHIVKYLITKENFHRECTKQIQEYCSSSSGPSRKVGCC